MGRLFIVTPVYNGLRDTLTLMRTLLPMAPPSTKIIVVDNGSSDGTPDILAAEYPEIILLHGNENLLWTGAINIGIRYALKEGAEHILFLNNDSLLHPLFLKELMIGAEKYPDAIISPKILSAEEPWRVWYMGGRIDWAKGKQWILGHNTMDDMRWETPLEVDWLVGMAMLVPTTIFHHGIWPDEEAFPHYTSDSDFSIRAKQAGYRLLIWPESRIYNKVKSSGIVEKFLLEVEPFSFSRFIQMLTSNRSSAAFCTFGKFVVRHAPVWSWPLTFIRFYGFFFMKFIQITLRLPRPRIWLKRKQVTEFRKSWNGTKVLEKEVTDNLV